VVIAVEIIWLSAVSAVSSADKKLEVV